MDSRPLKPEPLRSFSQHRVLLVEDDAVLSFLMKHLLERYGCAVDSAATLREALTLIIAGSYSLAVVDGHLPDGKGAELVRFMRTQTRFERTPVVAMSSDDSTEMAQAFGHAGATSFHRKPIGSEEVAQILQTYLTTSGSCP